MLEFRFPRHSLPTLQGGALHVRGLTEVAFLVWEKMTPRAFAHTLDPGDFYFLFWL